jgi:plasmid stability protein
MSKLLIRVVNESTVPRLKEKARRLGRSMNDIANEALERAVADTDDALWQRIEARRKAMSMPPEPSEAIIRRLRDDA